MKSEHDGSTHAPPMPPHSYPVLPAELYLTVHRGSGQS